jgi:hypothetical protein
LQRRNLKYPAPLLPLKFDIPASQAASNKQQAAKKMNIKKRESYLKLSLSSCGSFLFVF